MSDASDDEEWKGNYVDADADPNGKIKDLHDEPFPVPPALESSTTINDDVIKDPNQSFPAASVLLDSSGTANNKYSASITALVRHDSVDASSVISLGSSSGGGGGVSHPSTPVTIKTLSAAADDSVSASPPSKNDDDFHRPPALRTVSSGAFEAAGIKYSSSKSKERKSSGGLETLNSLGRSLRQTLSSTRTSSSLEGEGGGRHSASASGSSTPNSSNCRKKLGVASILASLGAADDDAPTSFNRGHSTDSRRVSNLLWDLGGTFRGAVADLCDTDHSHHDHVVGFGEHNRSSTFPHLHSKESKCQGNMSLHDPDSLKAVAEAEEAKERDRERREVLGSLCNPRLCVAIFLFASVVVGVTVGGMARAQNAAPANVPAVDDANNSGSGDGRGHHGENEEGGFNDLDVVAELEAKCTEANVGQWKGYKACHDLCERRYCCFLQDWDAANCVTSESERCPAYKKHCAVLGSVDPPVHDAPSQHNDEQQLEETVVGGNEELLASVKGQGQQGDASSGNKGDGNGEGDASN